LHREYQDRADFIVIYIREAHPLRLREFQDPAEDRSGLFGPATEEERRRRAQLLRQVRQLHMPAALLGSDGEAEEAYQAWPMGVVVIDPAGRVAYSGGLEKLPTGIGIDVARLETWLRQHLLSTPGPAPDRPGTPARIDPPL